jgi:putative endonuclease
MHFLYIIYSKQSNRFYIGETQNVEKRVLMHNQHVFKNAFTTSAKDWQLKLSFECESKEEASCLERFIKRMKSRVFIEKIIQNPTLLKEILNKK